LFFSPPPGRGGAPGPPPLDRLTGRGPAPTPEEFRNPKAEAGGGV
jgi:hypothetical protein